MPPHQRTLLLLLWLSASPALAQVDDPVAQQIQAFRETVRSAVAAKDRSALNGLYADNFKHIRDTGRTDGKRERIDSLLSGEEGIETAAEEDLEVEAYGPDTLIATGLSPVKDPHTGRTTRFQWLTLYVRSNGAWRIALSQASRYTARQ